MIFSSDTYAWSGLHHDSKVDRALATSRVLPAESDWNTRQPDLIHSVLHFLPRPNENSSIQSGMISVLSLFGIDMNPIYPARTAFNNRLGLLVIARITHCGYL